MNSRPDLDQLKFNLLKKSSVGRKSFALLKQCNRAIKRAGLKADDFLSAPPIIGNSFPKSGTHLLLQVLESFNGAKDFGTVLASMPSISYKEVPNITVIQTTCCYGLCTVQDRTTTYTENGFNTMFFCKIYCLIHF